VNFELIKDLLSAPELRRVEKEFDQLSEAEQLKIFLAVRDRIALEMSCAQREIKKSRYEEDIWSLEDDIWSLEELEKPIAEEIQRAMIRLGLDPVPGQLSLLEVAS
jgi:hypothetical protein